MQHNKELCEVDIIKKGTFGKLILDFVDNEGVKTNPQRRLLMQAALTTSNMNLITSGKMPKSLFTTRMTTSTKLPVEQDSTNLYAG